MWITRSKNSFTRLTSHATCPISIGHLQCFFQVPSSSKHIHHACHMVCFWNNPVNPTHGFEKSPALVNKPQMATSH
ncbi:hypothetical protein Hanom_Chr01g00048071 [Helianthus anomalus]